jgi:DNA-binding protein HU-beta
MNKAELVMAIADKTHMTKKDSEAALTAALDAIVAALADGERVQLVGFGSFEVKNRAERLGRNPQTGESVAIPPSKSPVFKASKSLKDAVNN